MSRIIIPEQTARSPREYETALVTILSMLVKVNALTFSMLEAIPDLREELCGCLYEWAHNVAFPRFRYMAQEIETTWEDLASDWYAYVMRMDRDEDEEDLAHPAMDRFLNMARMCGPRATVAYMMTAAGNFVRSVRRSYWSKRMTKEERKEREEEKKRRQENPEEQEKSLASMITAGQKAGVNPNVPFEAFTTGGYEDIELREAMDAFFRRIGQEKYLDATAVLSDALGYERKDIASLIHRGKHVQLAVVLVAEVSCRLHKNLDEQFAGYINAARAFILPPHLKESQAALLRALYRSTSSSKRAAFAGGDPLAR